MGRKKMEFSSKSKPQSMDEDLSTTEEFECDPMEVTTDGIAIVRTTEETNGNRSEAAPVKRGRGRPRLSDKIIAKRAAERKDVVKRKRGRPRKYDISTSVSKPAKSSRKSVPKIFLKTIVEGNFPRQRGRPRKRRVLFANSAASASTNESSLGPQVDRLASLVDRLENRINLDGLIDEDTDVESEQEVDGQIFLLQRNFNVNMDLKKSFKMIVKSYLEDLGAVKGCLIASVRSYKDSGKIILYEIWDTEVEQLVFSKENTSKIFDKETEEMLKTNTIVKSMNIPARWWQRSS